MIQLWFPRNDTPQAMHDHHGIGVLLAEQASQSIVEAQYFRWRKTAGAHAVACSYSPPPTGMREFLIVLVTKLLD
jgi:hypothetical protein